jgi:hypothetical protein
MIELQALGLTDGFGGSLGGAFAIPSFLLNRRLLGCMFPIVLFGVFAISVGVYRTGNILLLCLIPLCPLLLVGLGFAYYRYSRSWVGAAQLFASEGLLHRGSTMDFVVKQPTVRETTYDQIKVQVGMREWVRYSCGTRTCTDTYDHIVCENEASSLTVAPDSLLEHRVSFKLPVDLMHAFRGNDNRLSWFVRVIIDIKGLPETSQYYKIDLDMEIP